MAKSKNTLSLNIQPFDGNPSTVEFFFEQLDDIRQLNNFSEKEMVALFKTKLQGAALQFYLDSQFSKQAKNLAEIKTEFINFFSSKENSNIAFRSLDKLRLEENESVRNFSYRLNKNLKLAHPSVDDAALQILKFTYFMNALPKNIHIKLLEEGITEFDNALSRAEQLQNIYKYTDSPTTPTSANLPVYNLEHDNNSFPNSHSSDSKDSKTDLKRKTFHNRNYFSSGRRQKQNVNQNKFHTPYNRKNVSNSFRQKMVHQCAFCGRRGHLMKSCFDFRDFMQNMKQDQSFNNVNMLQQPPNDYELNQHNESASTNKPLN